MCFGALVCILYIFNRVQSCSIHIQSFTMIPYFLSQRPPKFTGHKKIASRNSRWQIPGTASSPVSESSHSQNQLPQIDHRKVSIFIYLQDLLRDNMRLKKPSYLSPRPSQGQHEIKNHPIYLQDLLRDNMRSKTILFIGHIPVSHQIHIVC